MNLKRPLPVYGRRKITPAVTQKVQEVLAQENGSARACTLNTLQELADVAHEISQDLKARGVPLYLQEGTVAHYTGGGPGKSYRRSGARMNTTQVTLALNNGTWCLTHAKRTSIFAYAQPVTRLALPKQAILSLLRMSLAGIYDIDHDMRDTSSTCLVDFIPKIAEVILPGDMSSHKKLTALGLLETLATARNSRP